VTIGQLREEVWNTLSLQRIATYPTPPHGHHPNFVGASRAAERLMALRVYQEAKVILAGPDQVLKPVREAAMKSGKKLVLPHPDKAGQYLLLENIHPTQLKRVRDVARLGQQVALAETPLDLVLIGAVAVDEKLGWIGKGYGFPYKALEAAAPWATLAHTQMIYAELPVEAERKLSLIATPHQVMGI
jgi:5-formyltetrahydrofolate cyclo-ligase